MTDLVFTTSPASSDRTFTTQSAGGGSAAVLSGWAATSLSPTAELVAWNSDIPATSRVDYGLTAAYGSVATDAALLTAHSVPLGGLTPGTVYHYRVIGVSADGLTTSGPDAVFTSAPSGAPALVPLPVLQVEVDVTNQPTSSTFTWTSIAAVALGATTNRGRQQESGRDQAGTLSLDLWNGDDRFSFFNSSGPFAAGFRPMARIRVRAVWSGTTYNIFQGFLDGPVLSYPGVAGAMVSLTATDAFKVLQGKLLSVELPAERSGARVNRVLDLAGWPTSLRSIMQGVSRLQASTLDGVSALDHLLQVADSESGRLFVDSGGSIQFRDRHLAYLSASAATFGEAEINYVDLAFAGDESRIANEITNQREGGEVRTQSDLASQLSYFIRTRASSGMLYDNDNESDDKGAFELQLYKHWETRITSLDLDGTYQPDLVYPQSLGRELGDKITVRKRPPVGDLIEQPSFVEGVTHTIGPGSWATQFRLDTVGIAYQIYPAGKAMFQLGDSTSGRIGPGWPGVLTY